MKRHRRNKLNNLKDKAFLLLLLFVAGVAEAQTHEFAPIGAEWHYGIKQFSTEGYVRIKSLSDTIIDGTSCKILEKRCFLYDHLDGIEKEFVKGHEYVFLIFCMRCHL